MNTTTLTELNRVLDALMLDLDGADEVHASKLCAFFDQIYLKAKRAKKLAETAQAPVNTKMETSPDILAALRDIVAVADRETEPFIRARAAINAAEVR